MEVLKRINGVLQKELKTEFKNLSSASAVFLFVLTSVIIISYAISAKHISDELFAGITWVLIFFTSMIGQSRIFVSEEERETWLFLKINSDSTSIFFGKIVYNILFGLVANSLGVFLLILFNSNFEIAHLDLFWMCILVGSFGISASSTTISALIAKSSSKGALFPVLAFPLLLPILLLAIDATILSIVGASFDRIYADINMIIGYGGAVATASYLLFDFIYKD